VVKSFKHEFLISQRSYSPKTTQRKVEFTVHCRLTHTPDKSKQEDVVLIDKGYDIFNIRDPNSNGAKHLRDKNEAVLYPHYNIVYD
jgi:hypothetical protein